MPSIPKDWPESEGALPPSLEWLLGKLLAAINNSVDMLKADMNQVGTWYAAMRRALELYIQASYMAGQDSDYLGVTESGHIYDYVKTQVDFLDNFRLVIQSAPEWSEGWKSRAESYARGIIAPYWKGRTKVLPLPAMPGDLTTDCGQLCACLWDVRTIDEEAGDYDAYWILNASRVITTEHCQDCVQRASEWSPLRIRGGRLQIPFGGAGKEFLEIAEKHLPGKHDQKTHGLRGNITVNAQDKNAQDSIKKNITEAASRIGTDLDIEYVDEFKPSDLGEDWGVMAEYKSGKITLYQSAPTHNVDALTGVIAHEHAHSVFRNIEDKVGFRGVFMNSVTMNNDFSNPPSFSYYAATFWRSGKNWQQGVRETFAEIYRLRSIGKGDSVTPEWNEYFDFVESQ